MYEGATGLDMLVARRPLGEGDPLVTEQDTKAPQRARGGGQEPRRYEHRTERSRQYFPPIAACLPHAHPVGMSTFEGGWICESCWKSNRESDLVCYRCKALQPGYRVVADEPRRREPRQPRTSVLRPIARRVAAVGRGSTASAARLVSQLGRGSLAAGRLIVLVPVNLMTAAITGVARLARVVGRFAAAVSRITTDAGRGVATAAMGVARAAAAAVGHGEAWIANAIGAAARGLGAGVNRVAASLGAIARRLATGPRQGHQQR
jgi:hypothetical protein